MGGSEFRVYNLRIKNWDVTLVDPPYQRSESFPPRARLLSLHHGTAMSALSSPRTAVDQRARTPRTLAMSPSHTPQLPFEHHPHPLSLPCLISRKLTLSRALLSPEFRVRRAGRLAHQKLRQATPSSVPR
jgi:hypothetical protein